MNYLRRSILNIIRKPSKSLLLFFIVLLLGNLVCGSYAIMQSTNIVKNNIKQQLGAYVTIHANSKMNSDKMDYIISENYEIYKKELDVVNVFKDAVNNEIVQYSDYMYSYNEFESRDIINSESDINYSEEKEIDPLTSLEILGVSQPYFSDVKYERIDITDGRTFTDEEIQEGKHVIILDEKYKGVSDTCEFISYETIKSLDEEYYVCNREESSLEIGDKIHLVRQIYSNNAKSSIGYPSNREVYYEDSIEYEIIGFYKQIETLRDNTFSPSYMLLNGDRVTTYMSSMSAGGYIPVSALMNDIDVFQKYVHTYIHSNKEIIKSNHLFLNSLFIELNEPEKIEEFVKDIESKYKNNGFYDLEYKSSKDAYDLVAGSIVSLSTISRIVLIAAVVISIIILTLVVFMFLKDRRYEIGIYISLGERKWKIISQIVLETCLISVLALNLSIITGNKLGNIITDKVLETSKITEVQLNEMESVNLNNLDIQKTTETITFTIDSSYMAGINMIGLFVIVISSIMPIMYILRLDPKKILM